MNAAQLPTEQPPLSELPLTNVQFELVLSMRFLNRVLSHTNYLVLHQQNQMKHKYLGGNEALFSEKNIYF